MQVKVFRASNMKEALRQVKEVFGQDALILSTRTVRKQRFGFMRAPELEVTAAREDKSWASSRPEEKTKFRQELKTQVNGLRESLGATYDQRGRLELAQESDQDSARSGQDQVRDTDIRDLHNEMRELRRLLTAHAARKGTGAQDIPDTEKSIQPEVQFLLEKGVNREAAEAIITETDQDEPQEMPLDSSLAFRCKERLAKWVKVADGLIDRAEKGRRIVFLGPTGVGKTTTLAKLAALYLQRWGRDILLVTIDNYRIAAAEQLQIYAQIMNIPLEVVSTPEQLSTVLRRQGVNKLTLIDTAGRNPWDEEGVQELKEFLAQGQGFDNYLVLSATTREEDLHGIADRFSSLGLNGLIFTKLDETRHYASLVNVHHKTGCPLTYITDGQRVPEDLQPADPEYVSRIIVNPDENMPHDDQTIES